MDSPALGYTPGSTTDVYIECFLQALDCPRALTICILKRYGEWDQLFDVQFNPADYVDLDAARSALSATSFLSKARFITVPWDPRKRAIDKFHEAEESCRLANHRLRRGRFKNALTSCILSRMQSKISWILGQRVDGEELVDSCGWGPGATVLLPRHRADQPNKFASERQVTAEAYHFIKDWFQKAYPLWADFFLEIVPGNKVITVPKNSKTDRVIAIEPGINSWFQKGCGKMIRRRLQRVGLDLDDQRPNQERSRLGSKFNNLATVDFSAASDTISYELVEQLLPREWFLVLDSFRSGFGSIDGERVAYAKFSSMGNGYTFELESLIFYALALAVCEHLGVDSSGVSVFGDDVIIPPQVYELFKSVSSDIGFTVNESKTFVNGPFRESCGEYHWLGARIKPIFQKEEITNVPAITLAANSVRRLSHRWLNSLGCDKRFYGVYSYLSDLLGKDYPRISEGFGELGLIENIDNARVRCDAAWPLEGFYVRCWATVVSQKEANGRGLLIYKIKGVGSTEIASGNSIPTSRVRVARRRVLIRQWYDLGPWV